MRRLLWTVALVAVCATTLWAAAKASKDTPAAAKTRRMLKQKVSVDYKETRLRDVAVDLQKQLDNRVSIKLDNEGGVSNNLALTYSATDKPLAVVLDEMFAKNQLGYVVISNSKDRRDGFIIIKKGKQRGYEAGEEPTAKDKKEAVKDKEKPDEDRPAKDKEKEAKKDDPAKDKEKAAKKDKPTKDKTAKDKSEADSDRTETVAAAKLKLIRSLHRDGVDSNNKKLLNKARERYKELIKAYPNTKAAEEARALLKKLEK